MPSNLVKLRVLAPLAVAAAVLASQGEARDPLGFGPHNLNGVTDRDESVCTFCHTPRGTQRTAPDWFAASPDGPFETFDTRSSSDRVRVIEDVSIACLSCHDGSQAPDVAPTLVSTETSQSAPAIARPMTREHPVGIIYSGYARRSQSYATTPLNREFIDGEVQWWLDLEAAPNGVRDKTDIVFYTRRRDGAEQPVIECSTCHDPHANPGRKFLRAPNAGSRLCLACHTI